MESRSVLQTIIGLVLVASVIGPVLYYMNNKLRQADPVKVSLYDESYCPACRQFVTFQLGPAWEQLSDIMEVELVAYGWTEETPLDQGYNFTCQHGPDECTGNMILECAKAHIPQQDSFIKLAVCFMSDILDPPPPFVVGKKCAHKLGVKKLWPAIKKCATSLEGQQLLHEAGVKFHALKNPEPTWVPWILINGMQSDKAEEDLKAVVCSTYKGQPPAGCPSFGGQRNSSSTVATPEDHGNQTLVL